MRNYPISLLLGETEFIADWEISDLRQGAILLLATTFRTRRLAWKT